MPQYTPFTIAQVFEEIWENWPNKEGEGSAQKAVTIFLKSDNNKDDLLKACEIYRLENLNTDPQFTYKLANFVNMDHWRDSLEGSSLDKLQKQRLDALELITEWNKACKPHWIQVSDIEIPVGMVQKSLAQKYFRDNWRVALDKASKIFQYKPREGDPREKLNLTLRWFTTTKNDRHTVLRIMDGEYGQPIKEVIHKEIPSQPIDYEARQQLAKEMIEMFPDISFKKKETVEELQAKKEKLILTPEAIALAETMKHELGKRSVVRYDKNNTEKIAKEILRETTDTIGDSATERSSEADPFEFD